jgi:hypothetical protein
MSEVGVWFVKINEKGVVGKPTITPPTSPSETLPRVVTIHVANWSSSQYSVKLSLQKTPPNPKPGDVLIVVPNP